MMEIIFFRKKSGQRFCLWLFSLCFLLPIYGAVDSSLYQGEVPVASYLPADRQKAVIAALQQVLTNVTGNSNIMQDPAVRQVTAKPNTSVQSYNYVASVGEKPLMLQVHFSPKVIDRLLQNTHQPNAATTNTPVTTNLPSTSLASSEQDTTLQSVNMVVSGVANLQNYTAVLDYLRHLDGVADVNSKQTKGDRILLVLKISKTADDLEQTIAHEQKLIQGSNVNGSVLMYRWVGGPSVVAPTVVAGGSEPSAESATASSVQQTLSFGAAPIVEGVPTASMGSNTASTDDNTQAQSFAAPASNSTFVPEEGAS